MDYFTLDKELSKINEGDGTPMERLHTPEDQGRLLPKAPL